MKLVFLGTRGEIEARTSRHRMHTSLEVSYRGGRVMVDAGEDWMGKQEEVDPDAIVVTHAHPDHFPRPGSCTTGTRATSVPGAAERSATTGSRAAPRISVPIIRRTGR